MQGPHGSGKCQEGASPRGTRDCPRVAVTLSCLGGVEGTVHSPGTGRVSALSRCSGIPRLGLVTCGRVGERRGDEPRGWEWGWTELSDEAEERPKRWARGWERNMGPETQNVDLGGGQGRVAGDLETTRGALRPRTALTVVWSVRAVGPRAGGGPLPLFTQGLSQLLGDAAQTRSGPSTTARPPRPVLLVGVRLPTWWPLV